jgi:hypothetical protein
MRQLRTILWGIVAVAVIRLWVMPLWNSFWLDETLTVWAIRGGFWRIWRVVPQTPDSVAFSVLEWLTSRLGGFHETALRLPCVAAALAALYVYYRIGVEFIGRSAGLSLVALYLTVYEVVIEVPNARAYPLALLAESAALLWLLRWLRSGRVRDGISWMVCAVVAGHFHQFFFAVLPLQCGYVLWRAYRRPFVKTWQMVVCGLVGIALLGPAIPQFLSIAKQASILSWAPPPTFSDLFRAVTPIYVLPMLIFLMLLEWFEGKRVRWAAPQPTDAAELGALLCLAPTAIAFVLSWFTEVHMFHARWLLPTAPGAILLWGWLLQGIDSPYIRQMSLAAGLVASIVTIGGLSIVPDYRDEDWRSAVRSLPESGATLVYSTFPIARQLESLQQGERWSYLMAPVLAYRPDIQRADAFAMPFDFDTRGREYMEQLINSWMRNRDGVTVVTRESFAGPAWSPWVSGRLEKLGFRLVRTSEYGRVRVEVFEASPHRD